ncbi:hypothetical protein E8E11_003054 [Didymella keratinophila]|nr:hypothetical protein E8E11_003054 [Didymella keratinophila]
MTHAPRSPKAFGSLTLGGYDEDQFEPNAFTLPLDPDDSRPTSLKLQQITAGHTTNGSYVVLQEETYVNLDFTLPYLWLPESVCDRIADLFKLKFDNTTGLYLMDNDVHAETVAQNPSFTRRAANATQYTLGRAFMQEAYMIVDFEHGNFSLHQAAFPASNAQNIVAIPAKDAQVRKEQNGLSKGSIAGIATGSVIFAAPLIILTTLLVRRRRLRTQTQSVSNVEEVSSSEKEEETNELAEAGAKREQLMSSEVLELQWSNEVEIDGKARCELA